MFEVILYRPEIPPNTGNIIRLCANTGAGLHVIHPLGFELDEPRLRRAGLDYREFASVKEHPDLQACLAMLGQPRMFGFSTRFDRPYPTIGFRRGDALLFGPETSGLPADIVDTIPRDHRLTIPMRPGNRSLNLSNAVAVVVYEAWRQQEFEVV